MQRSSSQEYLKDQTKSKSSTFDRSTSLEHTKNDPRYLPNSSYSHGEAMSSPGAWIEYNKDIGFHQGSRKFFEMINQHPLKHHPQNTPVNVTTGHSMSSPLQHQPTQQHLFELSPLCPKYDIAGRSVTVNELGSPLAKVSTTFDLAQSPKMAPINPVNALKITNDQMIKDKAEQEDIHEDQFYSPQSSTESINSNEIRLKQTDTNFLQMHSLQSSSSLIRAEEISSTRPSIHSIANPNNHELNTSASESTLKQQIGLLQSELHGLQGKYEHVLVTNRTLRTVLADYEKTMEQIIATRATGDSADLIKAERDRLSTDLATAQIAYQNLLQRYDELKHLTEESRTAEQVARQRISELQAECAAKDRRYDALRKQAESKLDEANREIQACQEASEAELTVMKARLHKAELRMSTLESTIETKTNENAELMAICDELIGKMDNKERA